MTELIIWAVGGIVTCVFFALIIRQRRGLLSPFYYILATLALMLVMIDFTHHMWHFMVNPQGASSWNQTKIFQAAALGWMLVGALSMFTIGRVIQLLHQIRDK
jgi:hypothetical protein